jgi:hypothetical protein
MTIASVGTLGTAASSTAATSYTLTTTTNALANGDFAVLSVTTDNLSASGNTWDHVKITGGTGKWFKVYETTYSPGGVAADGIAESVWIFLATGTNAIGTVFTITLNGTVTDKVASAWKFTKAAGTAIRIARDTNGKNPLVTNGANFASGFGSLALSGLASSSRLWFRSLGKEANTTTGITVSTNFTAITSNRSRNNASAVWGGGEFRISTSTGETSNPTHAVAGDVASFLVALEEYTPSSTAAITVQWEASTSTCFKDAACTNAVTADGDEVLGIKDTNTGAILATGTAGSGPLYRTGGGKPYLESDGTKNLAGSFLFQFGDSSSRFMLGAAVWWEDLTVDGNGYGPGPFSIGAQILYAGLRAQTGDGYNGYVYGEDGLAQFDGNTVAPTLSVGHVISATCDGANFEVLGDGSGNGATSVVAPRTGGTFFKLMGGMTFVNRLVGRLYGFRIYLGSDSTTHTSMVSALTSLYPTAVTRPATSRAYIIG